LRPRQSGEAAVLRHQFVKGPLFDDFALIEDENAVGASRARTRP
jgi:hypothetical protein